MTNDSQNGLKALLNPAVQILIFVILVGGLGWLGVQLYDAMVGR